MKMKLLSTGIEVPEPLYASTMYNLDRFCEDVPGLMAGVVLHSIDHRFMPLSDTIKTALRKHSLLSETEQELQQTVREIIVAEYDDHNTEGIGR